MDCYSLYSGDYSNYETVNCEAVSGGYTVYDSDGSLAGTIPCDPASQILLAKGNMIFVVTESGSYSYVTDVYYIN